MFKLTNNTNVYTRDNLSGKTCYSSLTPQTFNIKKQIWTYWNWTALYNTDLITDLVQDNKNPKYTSYI